MTSLRTLEGRCFGHYNEKGKCKLSKFFCEDANKCFVYTKKLAEIATKVDKNEE